MPKRKTATNKQIILVSSGFKMICPSNEKRTNLIISNGEVAGKDAWLFLGNLKDAQAGKGFFLKAKGDPYRANGGKPYLGEICGIAVNADVEVGIVEY